MKVLGIGGEHPRHLHYFNAVAGKFGLAGLVLQTRERLVPETPGGLLPIDRANYERHFSERSAAEVRFFRRPDHPDCPTLTVSPDTLNTGETVEFVRRIDPDIVLLFGCALVKQPLLGALPLHTLNLHLGLSPRYRGAATLFWPFYFLEPAFAGSTVHFIVNEPDSGDIVHQATPSLDPSDGVHDVACKVVLESCEGVLRLLEKLSHAGTLTRYRARGSGKNFLARDFVPQHLRMIYTVFDNDIAGRYLAGELPQRRPRLFSQF